MPLRNRKRESIRNNIIIWSVITVLIMLMIISFPVTQNVTEIVLYP